MDSVYLSEKTKSILWPDFAAHFKSSTSRASYWSDLCEFAQIVEKYITRAGAEDVRRYYQIMTEKVKRGELQPGTPAKKFRELHSFSDFICRERERYGLPDSFADHFYGYLPFLSKQEKYARVMPVEDVDRLLKAAEKDRMAYTIFVLMYRVGLSSTEICDLETEDIGIYENGAYVTPRERQSGVFIPEDAMAVLESYMGQREERPTLFYNRRGNPLNTMYISRMMKKYTALACIPAYSSQMLRNTCAYNLFSYKASPGQVAAQMGVTDTHVKRYRKLAYKEELSRAAGNLVKIHVERPL